MKKIIFLSFAVVALLCMNACDREGVIYTPDNACVSFPSDVAVFEMVKEDGNKVTVQLNRGNTKGSVSIPVTIEDKTGGVFKPSKSSFDFADGEGVAYIDFTYPDINAFGGETYSVVLSVDESNVSPSGISEMTVKANRKLTRVKVGTGIYYSDWYEEAPLYIVIAADSGSGKSGVIKNATRPIEDEERDFNRRNAAAIANYASKIRIAEATIGKMEKEAAAGKCTAEDVQEALEERARIESEEKVTAKRIFTTNATVEKLANLIAQNGGRYAIISAEGSSILSNAAGRYNNDKPEASVFLSAHDGDTIRIDRVGREPDYIENPTLSMTIGVQPGILKELLKNPYFMESGFNQRLLFVCPRDNTGKRNFKTEAIPANVYREYSALIARAAKCQPGKEAITVEFTREALAIFESLYDHIESRLNEDLFPIKAWAEKYRGTVARIALCLFCMQGPNDPVLEAIDAATLRSAIRIGEYFISTAKAFFCGADESEEDRDAKYILRKLDGVDGTISKRDLFRLCRRFKPSDTGKFEAALKTLIGRGYIQIMESTGAHRHTFTVFLNPDIRRDSVPNVPKANPAGG